VNDTIENLEAVADEMKKLGLAQIDLLPYHAIARDKYRRLGKEYLSENVKEASESEIGEIRNFFAGKGFMVGIGG
jgi:pyruvate formate lyase activating enzyme